MENIGALAILLAFCLAIYAVIGSVTGKLRRNPFLIVSGERAVYGVWFLITLASAVLVSALLTGDFRFVYVAEVTNRAMPTIYKFTAWWGGQAGSLLLWSWLLSTYAAVVVFTNRHKHPRLHAVRGGGAFHRADFLSDPEHVRGQPVRNAGGGQGHHRGS